MVCVEGSCFNTSNYKEVLFIFKQLDEDEVGPHGVNGEADS